MDTLFEPEAPGEPSSQEHGRRGAGANRERRGAAGGSAREPAAGARGGHGERESDARGGDDPRPLAARIRPRALDEFVGQAHLLGDASGLRAAIERGEPHSMILYGPPGTGKTTLARMVAEHSRAVFEELSAVQAGRAEVRAVLERAAHRHATSGTRTVFFLDEIHRFNKAQQDALLPAVEEGLVTLIGATTENPAFEVNGALLSRMRVYALSALSAQDVGEVLRRALASPELDGEVEPAVLDFLAARTEGDARAALNALELALATAAELDEPVVGIERAEDALQRRAVLYDRGGDRHYDYISAWIKATRGSDPDASLYYLAVMLEGGEDPRFIVRRMVILASEDVGNADPAALSVAVAAAQAVEHVGLPEARYALAQAAIYLALAPKSNAAGRALGAASAHVRDHGAAPVPGWLRSGPRPGQEVGGYDYPHDRPGGVSPQELLPDAVAGARFYDPAEAEAELAQRLARIREARGRRDAGRKPAEEAREHDGTARGPGEEAREHDGTARGPGDEAHERGDAGRKPGEEAHERGDAGRKPGEEAHERGDAGRKPGEEAHERGDAGRKPGEEAHERGDAGRKPGEEAHERGDAGRKPGEEAREGDDAAPGHDHAPRGRDNR